MPLSLGCRSYGLSLTFHKAGPWVYHLLLCNMFQWRNHWWLLVNVRIIMSQLQADLAEEGVNQVSVMVYNTGSRSPNFTMIQSVMTIVSLPRNPRKVHCTL